MGLGSVVLIGWVAVRGDLGLLTSMDVRAARLGAAHRRAARGVRRHLVRRAAAGPGGRRDRRPRARGADHRGPRLRRRRDAARSAARLAGAAARAAAPSSSSWAGAARGGRCPLAAEERGPASGALRFARYAYPPNELGYCGPDASRQLLEQVAAGVDDRDLRRLLRGFEGAWPYLQLIAAANGIGDPLDDRVVEAYWVGNDLLDRVGPRLMGDSLETRFRGPGRAAVGPPGRHRCRRAPLPHHSFHVFGVYPWFGLLREGRIDGAAAGPRPVPGPVGSGASRSPATEAVVLSRPLLWDGRSLVPRRAPRGAGHGRRRRPRAGGHRAPGRLVLSALGLGVRAARRPGSSPPCGTTRSPSSTSSTASSCPRRTRSWPDVFCVRGGT